MPAAFALRCLGLVWATVGWRRRRSGYGLAGLIVAAVGLVYILLGIVLGIAFF